MTKKKNRNRKMAIAAGLLITPAIVAQAGVVQASVSVETLLAPFDALNESSTADAIAKQKANLEKFNKEGDTDGANLKDVDGTNLLPLLEAKITYLEEYQKHKTAANNIKSAITNLSTTKSNFIVNYENITKDLAALETAFKTSLNNLKAAAGSEIAKAPNLLTKLTYYPKSEEEALAAFKTATITQTSLTNLAAKGALVTSTTKFLADYVTPLVTLVNDTNSKDAAITEKVTGLNTAIAALKTTDEKNAINNYEVTLTLGESSETISVKNLLTGLTSGFAELKKLQTAITKLSVTPPTSATTLKSNITTIESTYNKVPAYLKRFVSDYDASIIKYKETLDVVEQIDKAVANKESLKNEELLKKIADIKTAYNALGSVTYQDLVTNFSKLTALEEALNTIAQISTELETQAPLSTEKVSTILTDYATIKTEYLKYFTTEHAALLKDWAKNEVSAKKVDTQIDGLSTTAFATMGSATESKKKSTTDAFIKNVETVKKAYDAISTPEQGFNQKLFVQNSDRLLALYNVATVAKGTLSFTVLDARNEEKLNNAVSNLSSFPSTAAGLSDDDKLNLPNLKTYLDDYLTNIKNENQLVATLIEEITAVSTQIDLVKVASIRERYDTLSKDGKGLVTNYATFKTIEDQNKAAMNVTTLIEKIDVGGKDFISKTIAAKNAYDKLSPTMGGAVTNASTLKSLYDIAELMNAIDKLRPSDKTFRTQLTDLRNKFKTLTANSSSTPSESASGEQGETAGTTPVTTDKVTLAVQRLVKEYDSKLANLEAVVSQADSFVTDIANLNNAKGKAFMDALADLTARYKKLDSSIKTNITNGALLTELERDYKAALKVYTSIESLPVNTDKSFSSKVAAAEKAYQKLTDKQKDYVYNYAAQLADKVKVGDIIARIEKLKVGSKTYQSDVEALRTEYKALTKEQQALVHNISKLDGAETAIGNADKVILAINAATPTAENYIEKLVAARTEYDKLSKIDQKLVTNYKDLQSRERAVKPVLKLDDDILKLDPSNAKMFISKFKSAEKAYEKLMMAERALLLNKDKLGEMKQLFNVINAINSVKNSSKTFVQDTKAARALYDALADNLKPQVSNYSVLQDHERNVEGGSSVDKMIQALNNSEPKDFIANVKAAREAYKGLSSANKKAVTLEKELKAQEKYIKPVEAAIKAIDDLSNPSKDLSRQFTTVNKALQKLDAKQMTYVTNIDKYSNLSNVIHTYTLIANLKPSDKYYQGNIEAAKISYDKLSEDEKLKVTNYYKLQEALLDIAEVQNVIGVIASLSPTSNNYFADVEKALADYKALPSGSRKQVSNYDVLKNAEKDMKAAQKVIKQVDELDATLRTYESKAKAAKKAYEKLTNTQKPLVYNYNKLQSAIFELGL